MANAHGRMVRGTSGNTGTVEGDLTMTSFGAFVGAAVQQQQQQQSKLSKGTNVRRTNRFVCLLLLLLLLWLSHHHHYHHLCYHPSPIHLNISLIHVVL